MPVRDGPIALLGANYELIILLVELIFCWGTELRKYGLPLMLTGGAAFVVLPWLVPGLHNAPVFLIGTVSVGHEVMILISLLLIYGSFRVSWQQTFLYGTLAAILQFLWFIAFLLLNAAFNLLSNWWIPVEIVMQLLVYLAAAMLIRPLVTSKERIVIPGKVQVFGCIVTILILHSFYDDLVGILSSPQTERHPLGKHAPGPDAQHDFCQQSDDRAGIDGKVASGIGTAAQYGAAKRRADQSEMPRSQTSDPYAPHHER